MASSPATVDVQTHVRIPPSDHAESARPTTDVVVAVRGLRKTYGDLTVVDGLDLTIHRGEVFALLGPNGAGKTTTVDILTGVRGPTSGTVEVLGEDPRDDRREWRNRLGVVPQTTGEYLDLTVREVVAHFASFYSRPLPTDELLERVGLTGKARALSTTLSGGQKRRLDVAVGVVGRPELVLLDEPTTGLDPVARREAWELVRYLRELGTTTILTTHYLDEAEELADRAGIIAGGRMLEVGTIAELGRRAGAGTTIAFTDTRGLGDDLTGLPATRDPHQPLGRCVVHTDRPTEVLDSLIRRAREVGLSELTDLTVVRPSLEDTYLRLIGAHQETSS